MYYQPIPGKIPYIKQATIDIVLSSGTMINQQEWVPSIDHNQRFGNLYLYSYQDLNVSIELDGKILISDTLDKTVSLNYMFEDSETEVDHCLQITVSGFDLKHHDYIPDIGEVSTMIKIDSIQIENLSMHRAIEDAGQYWCENNSQPQVPGEFAGQNGIYKFQFKTPIYPWLLSIEQTPDYFIHQTL
jgi:hypothetical protein